MNDDYCAFYDLYLLTKLEISTVDTVLLLINMCICFEDVYTSQSVILCNLTGNIKHMRKGLKPGSLFHPHK